MPLGSTVHGGGLDANKLASPINGMTWQAIDTGKFYRCYVDGVWVLEGGGADVACYVRSGVQTLGNMATVTVSWGTEDKDTDGFIAVPATTLTIPTGKGGNYLVTGFVSIETNATGMRQLELFMGGSKRAMVHAPPVAGGVYPTSFCFTAQGFCADGSTVYLNLFQNSGSDLALESAALGLRKMDKAG